MKVFLGVMVTLLALEVSAEEAASKLLTNSTEACIEEIGIELSAVENKDIKTFENDQKAKCFIRCLMQKTGFLDDKDELDFQSIKATLNISEDNPFHATLVKCKDIKKEDPCDTAYTRQICFADVA